MKSAFLATLSAAALTVAAAPASAGPVFGSDDLQRNGAISRHYWKPNFANADSGMPVSAGLAIGLKGAPRHQFQRSVTPALVMELSPKSSVSILPGGGRGTMIMLQTQL